MPGPLLFTPLLKRIRWGGTKLGTELQKPIGDATDAAESWEIADHAADQTRVATGKWTGRTLAELVERENRHLFGRHAGLRQFPLLIKFLDASDRLSLQVHPNDVQAKQYNPEENGKTEAWVILQAEPGSRLYAGLKSGVDREQLSHRLANGTIEECLHSFEVDAGECLFIPAGTVHAIGEGVLLAEVQQSSDLTFRLHDWGRLGQDGKPRPLHVRQSLDCIDYRRGPVNPVTPIALDPQEYQDPLLPDHQHHQHEELLRCEHFVLRRHRLGDPFVVPDDNRFHVLIGLDGAGELVHAGENWGIARGETLLLPAERESTVVQAWGDLTVLDAFLP